MQSITSTTHTAWKYQLMLNSSVINKIQTNIKIAFVLAAFANFCIILFIKIIIFLKLKDQIMVDLFCVSDNALFLLFEIQLELSELSLVKSP